MSNLIPILAVGGIVVFISKKRKKKKAKGAFVVLDSKCRVSMEDVPTGEAEMDALNGYVMRIIKGAFKSSGVEKLGEPPGEEEANNAFVRAAATHAFKSSIHSDCLKSMGVAADFGADTNTFGADFTDWNGEWPGDSREWFEVLVGSLSGGIETQGYEFGPTQAIERVYSGNGRAPSPADSIINFITRKR